MVCGKTADSTLIIALLHRKDDGKASRKGPRKPELISLRLGVLQLRIGEGRAGVLYGVLVLSQRRESHIGLPLVR